MTDKLDAATIRELLAKITPEPWEVGPDVSDLPYRYSNFIHGHNVAKARVLNANDAEFIAAAPAIARYALELSDKVKELEAEASLASCVDGVARVETCMMADCTEPQAHFCVTHVLEVHCPEVARVPVAAGRFCSVDDCPCHSLTLSQLQKLTATHLPSMEARAAAKEIQDEFKLGNEQDRNVMEAIILKHCGSVTPTVEEK